jgi:hypothetical protein
MPLMADLAELADWVEGLSAADKAFPPHLLVLAPSIGAAGTRRCRGNEKVPRDELRAGRGACTDVQREQETEALRQSPAS